MTSALQFHATAFDYPDDFRVRWHPGSPDLACAANAVSLLMPHVEPYVVRSIRAVADGLDEPLRADALAYARQEGQHHAQHRRFNDLVIQQVPWLRTNERLMARAYRMLERHTSARFGVAFAAGFETVAYTAARWVDARRVVLLTGADAVARDLFLWHLAEEVEHKTVAHDVNRAIGATAGISACAMVLAAMMLAVFAFLNTMVLLSATGRVFNPLAHLRLLLWSVTFIFDLLPAMAVAVLPGHHPRDLVDPWFYSQWLDERRLDERRLDERRLDERRAPKQPTPG
jgi:predicted metal-dependent hydrolase